MLHVEDRMRYMNTCDIKTDIVILGAGIGGYEAFRTLARKLKRAGINKKITLIDKNNYFTFVPMLHEVATGSILPSHAAIPLREIMYKTPHNFVNASVVKIDPKKKTVETTQGTVFYDYCITALGSETNFFNTPGTKEFCHHVRTLPAALELRQDFVEKLEFCETNDDFYVTVVGGGYTGVEVAGQFCDLAHNEIKKLYPEKKLYIQIVQAGETLLPWSPKKIQQLAKKRLQKEGVQVFFNARAKEVTEKNVLLSNGNKLKSDVTIWTAGFKNIGICFMNKEYCVQDRILVNQFLQHPKYHSLYAIGDIAMAYNVNEEQPIPQLGEAAHRQGQYVAEHLVHVLKNKTLKKPFHFKAHGSLMPIGDWYGIAKLGPFIFSGKLAWWIRRTAYVAFMPGFIRKVRIVFDWTLHGFGFRNTASIRVKTKN